MNIGPPESQPDSDLTLEIQSNRRRVGRPSYQISLLKDVAFLPSGYNEVQDMAANPNSHGGKQQLQRSRVTRDVLGHESREDQARFGTSGRLLGNDRKV